MAQGTVLPDARLGEERPLLQTAAAGGQRAGAAQPRGRAGQQPGRFVRHSCLALSAPVTFVRSYRQSFFILPASAQLRFL